MSSESLKKFMDGVDWEKLVCGLNALIELDKSIKVIRLCEICGRYVEVSGNIPEPIICELCNNLLSGEVLERF